VLQVYQHWDKLKTCIVGQAYPPQFFSYIKNPRVRNVFEKIAIETEEDFQKLIKLLESFNVKVLRPNILDNFEHYYNTTTQRYSAPTVSPRDYCGMIGNEFYWDNNHAYSKNFIVDYTPEHEHILNFIKDNNNTIITGHEINTASVTRVGKDLFFGTTFDLQPWWEKIKKPSWPKLIPENVLEYYTSNKHYFIDHFLKKNSESAKTAYKESVEEMIVTELLEKTKLFPNNRCHVYDTGGHIDGVFCPVVPGLIVSRTDFDGNFSTNFPDWEVFEINTTFDALTKFKKLRAKNSGRWWVPGEENNHEFTDFVEELSNHWVGNIEETSFDVNMLVIDEKNVVCNNHNKEMFDVFKKYNITPHVIDFRYRHFWDCGWHCATNDIDREGNQVDYFPEREIK